MTDRLWPKRQSASSTICGFLAVDLRNQAMTAVVTDLPFNGGGPTGSSVSFAAAYLTELLRFFR